jgi:uncharacterized protein (TIGR02147 family)
MFYFYNVKVKSSQPIENNSVLGHYISMDRKLVRPSVTEYQSPEDFVRDMINYRKSSERAFSVHKASKSLRRVSPALVSLILKKKRAITLDRTDEISKLLKLNTIEKLYFRSWIERIENRNLAPSAPVVSQLRTRKEVPVGILKDWLNVYVKDYFHLIEIQKNPKLLHQQLAHLATPKRINRAIDFLLKQGHLRRTQDGSIVIETNLSVSDSGMPNEKIRQFHKAALALARSGMDLYPAQERISSALVLQLNQKSFLQFKELLDEFSEKLKIFAEQNTDPGERLYQFVFNLAPLGRKL